MALSRQDVVQAFELILGRTPDEGLIAQHARLPLEDRRALAEHLIGSDEFRARYDRLADRGLAPAPRTAQPQGPVRPATVFLGDRVLTATHRGQKIYVAPRDMDLSPHIMMHGTWEQHVERAATSQLRAGDVAIDVGANVGYHTLALAEAVGRNGRVHAFEANPELVRLLRPTLAVNGYQDFVTLHHRAVLDRPGAITLASYPEHFGSGNVMPASPDEAYNRDYCIRHKVEGVTLDATLEALPSVDLIRIDIEGSEPQALRGGEALIARSPGIGIVAEWAVGMMASRSDVPAFVEWLVGMGFRFWIIAADGALFQPVQASALPDLPHSDVFISRRGPV